MYSHRLLTKPSPKINYLTNNKDMKFIFYFKSTHKYEVTVLEKKVLFILYNIREKKKKTLVQNPGQLRRSGKTHQVSTVVSCEACPPENWKYSSTTSLSQNILDSVLFLIIRINPSVYTMLTVLRFILSVCQLSSWGPSVV